MEIKKSQTAIDGEVVKRSNKAVQVKIAQGTFWFPMKSVTANEDGRIIAISTKMLAEKAEEQKHVAASNQWKRNGWAVQPKSRIRKETEKAVQVEFEGYGSHRDVSITLWFPKSQTKIEDNSVYIKAWIFLKNAVDRINNSNLENLAIYSKDENGMLVSA